ncbi:Hypothetical protein PENO1_111340 [Aspergillus udagawae]|uniref:Uncharacterized protein n=1 Tax=Aspergillus udagawae TaxID=91492 RepID=A0A8H3PC45_9EURO|nr:Hypothetical protein PENO1_111340 [Aspergillus udagawae]
MGEEGSVELRTDDLVFINIGSLTENSDPGDHHNPAQLNEGPASKICKRDPFSGKVVTGGIVTVADSSWLMSWTINRQPHFKNQPRDQIGVRVYALPVDVPGDYVKRPMQYCTGEEITLEWLYHLGVPTNDSPALAAAAARCVPVMMPYVTAFFMPRHGGDRLPVVPEGAVNFT